MDNNNGLLKINSLGKKNDKGEYELIPEYKKELETLSLGSEENGPKELITKLEPSSSVKSPEAEQQKNERSL